MKHDQKESRRRFSPEAKANHISSWLNSTQTRREYCVAEGLNYCTFSSWVNDWRRKERHEKSTSASSVGRKRFCRLSPTPATPPALAAPCSEVSSSAGAPIDLYIAEKYRLHLEEGFSPAALHQILLVLKEISC